MTTPVEAAPTTPSSSNPELDAVTRLVAETEQRRREQIGRIAELGEQAGEAAAAERLLAEQVLKEIETTLGLARAYRTILQSLSET